MNVFAKFDEIPSMVLEDTTNTLSVIRTDRQRENRLTIYPLTNTVCGGGYNNAIIPTNHEILKTDGIRATASKIIFNQQDDKVIRRYFY